MQHHDQLHGYWIIVYDIWRCLNVDCGVIMNGTALQSDHGQILESLDGYQTKDILLVVL